MGYPLYIFISILYIVYHKFEALGDVFCNKTCDSCQKLATGAEWVVREGKICHNKCSVLYCGKVEMLREGLRIIESRGRKTKWKK